MPSPPLVLSANQVDGITFALDVLAQKLSGLVTQQPLTTEMAGLSQPMASLFDFGGSLRQDWTQPLQAQLLGPQTADSLSAGILAALNANGLVSISPIVHSLEVLGSNQTLWFEITFDASQTLVDYTLDLGLTPSGDPLNPSPGDAGLWVSPIQTDVEASLAGKIRIGINLDPTLSIDQAIRLQIDDLELSAMVNASVQGVQARYGIFNLGLNDINVTINNRLALDLLEDSNGYVTLGALTTLAGDALFDVTTAGDGMTVTLPFLLDIGGFTQSLSTQNLVVRALNGFAADGLDIELPTINFSGSLDAFDFSKFTQIQVSDLGTYLTGLQEYLPNFAGGEVVPLLDKNFSQVLALDTPLNSVIEALRDPDTGGWSFLTVQEMIAGIGTQLGIAPTTFALRWSAIDDSIEWDMSLYYTDSIVETFSADAIVPTGSVLAVSGNGSMTIDADLDITLTGGVAIASSANMNPITLTTLLSQLNGGYGLTTLGLLNPVGVPTNDISFNLRNGTSIGFDLNTLALGGGGLPGTATVQSLLTLFNASSTILASFADNQLTIKDLTVPNGSANFSVVAPSLTINVGQGIAATTLNSLSVAPLALGLAMAPQQADQITGLSLESLDPRDRLYLVAEPVVSGTIKLSATLEGGAALGPLALQIVDGELEGSANWTLTLLDPATGANDARLYFSEIVETFDSGIVNALDSMLSIALTSAKLEGIFQLKITPDALLTTLGVNLTDYSTDPVDLAVNPASPLAPNTNLVPYIEVDLLSTGLDGGWVLTVAPSVKLSSILNNGLTAFSWDDLPALLDLLITQLEGTALWQVELPLTDKTVGDLLSLRSALSGLDLPLLANYIEPLTGPNIGSLATSLNAAFTAALPDFSGTFASFKTRAEGLQEAINTLELAWSGRSPGDTSFEADFLGRVNAWRSDLRGMLAEFDAVLLATTTPPASLVTLQAAFASALGFADLIPSGLDALTGLIEEALEDISGVSVTITPSFIPSGSSAGRLDFKIDMAYVQSGTFDLGSMALSAGTVLDITGAGGLAYNLTGSVNTHIGFDFGTLLPVFDLADADATLLLSVDDGPGLVLVASLGGLASVSIGSIDSGLERATLALTKSATALTPAEFNLIDGSLTGSAYFAASLPVYVDLISGSAPVASIDVDVTASLVIVSSPTPSVTFTPTITVNPTVFSSIFTLGNLDAIGWIDGAILLVEGLRTGLESDLLNELPFIGDIDLSSSGFLADLEGVLQTLAAYDSPVELVAAINAGFASIASLAGSTVSLTLRGDPLNATNQFGASVAPANALWLKTFDQIYNDSLVNITDELVFNLNLQGTFAQTFDAGVLDLNLDSLDISVSGSAGIDLALDVGMNIGLGWSPGSGFFLQGAAGNAPELTANVGLGFTSGSVLAVNLGPLAFSLTDATPGPNDIANLTNRELNADIVIDLGDGKLTGNSGSGLFANANVALTAWQAQLDLDLTAKLSASGVGLGASMLIGYAMPTPITSLSGLSNGAFTFAITDTFIDLGDLIGAPTLQAIATVKKAFEPLQPVLDLLASDVPLISDVSQLVGLGPVTFVDAIALFGDGSETAAEFIGVINAINDTANSFDIGSGSLRYSLGGLTPVSSASLLASTPLSKAAFTSIAPTPTNTGTFATVLQNLEDIGLTFPILDNPGASLFDLLFGRDVTLVNWDIPDLEAGFDFRQTFAIYPPLYLTLFGGVTFETNFDLGYDTRGIRQFVGAGSEPAKAGLLLNGLFLIDELGNELELTAVIGAGLELNVAVAKAGVEGGLTGIIGADLDDPNNDGKVHIDELAYNFSRGPECIFDFNGSLSVFLAAYIQVGMSTPFGFVELYNQRFELFDATLFDWNLETCPPVDPKLAEFIVSFDHDGNGATANVATLVLNMGPRAVLVIPGDSSDGDEVFTVDLQRNEDGTLHALGGLTVTGNGYSQSFNAADLTGVSWISFEGGVGNDSVVIAPDVTLSVWGRGGDGNDNLFGGSGINVLFGDADSDMLVGRLADDILSGGDGNDFIYGYGGADLLDGGNGADAIFGDDDLGNMVAFNADNPLFKGGLDGADTISGGEGNDRIVAGAENDLVRGGAGDDVIDAGAGNDHVQGDAGNDQILGSAGDDDLWGDDLAGSVTQGSATLNADKIQGGSGYNRIWGGPGNDLLYAGDEVQLALAPAVAGPPSGWSTLLYGGDGADMLYGTAGADRLEGGFGSDYIESGTGADLLLGGPGNDGLIAAGGNATLFGSHGDDLIDGGDGQNWIEGGPGHDDIYAGEGADTLYGGTTAIGYEYLLADLAGPRAVIDPLHGGIRSTVSPDGCEPVIYYYPEVYAPTFGPLKGEIFFDTNVNGVREGNEPPVWGVQDWRVVITDVTRTVTLLDTTVSNSVLSLAQGGLPTGDYWIVLAPMVGNTWLPTNSTSSVEALVNISSLGASYVPQFAYYKTNVEGYVGPKEPAREPTAGTAAGGKSLLPSREVPEQIWLSDQASNTMSALGGASIHGTVWLHNNNDPLLSRSESEPGVADQTMVLLDLAGTVVATALTDVSGNYTFAGFTAGAYTIRQAPELSGLQLLAEGSQILLSAQVMSVGGNASINGIVWWHNDNDSSLSRSLSEPGIAGQTIELLDLTGAVVATAVTDVSGKYSLEGLAAGTYTVRQAPELPWRQVVAEGAMLEQIWLSAQVSDKEKGFSTLKRLDFSTGQAIVAAADLPIQVRDVALMGQSDVYLSGSVSGAMGSTNGLWHYNLQTKGLTQLGKETPAILALDVLSSTRLLGLTASSQAYNFDIPSQTWSLVGTLLDDTGRVLQTVGDVAVVSPSEAYVVVALANSLGGAVPPDGQLLVSFNPTTATITSYTTPLRIQNAPTRFIGLEWDGASLKALGENGQVYRVDTALGTVTPYVALRDMAPGLWGGLAQSEINLSLAGNKGEFTVTLEDNKPVTIGFGNKPDAIVLQDGDDRIDGGCGPEADLLYGDDGLNLPVNVITIGGYDTIRGREGDDTIDGGKKGDVLSGDEGNDLIIGGRGASNLINGADGQDTLTGGPAADIILGGAGHDTLNGLAGEDWLYGEAGNDSVSGGAGNDLLVGGAGTDIVLGNDGDDQLIVINTELGGLYGTGLADVGGDVYDGGAGVDRIVVVFDINLILTASTLTLAGAPTDAIVSIEQSWLKGGASPNVLDASAFNGRSWIFGEGGNDTLLGGAGSDWIDGGGSNDTMTGGLGHDTLLGGAGANTMAGGLGNDRYVIDNASSSNNLTEAAGAGADTVDMTGVLASLNVELGRNGGRDLWVNAITSAGPDVDGSGGEFETLLLGSGNDMVQVATGIDPGFTVKAHDGIDTLDYSGASNGDPWSAPVVVNLGAGLATGLAAAIEFENVIGGNGNDTLIGSNLSNLLNGGPGNDILSGLGGDDNLIGGPGNDSLYGGTGNDVLQGQGGQNMLEGGVGNDVYVFSYIRFSDQTNQRALSTDGFDALDFSGQSQNIELRLNNELINVTLADGSALVSQEARGLEVIIGGSARDVFLMADATTLPAALLVGGPTASNAFSDANQLNYRDFTTRVRVDLQDATNFTTSSIGIATGTLGIVNLRHVVGGAVDDTLRGGNLAVWFEGGDGNDELLGSIQDDLLHGGDGNDSVLGGAGDDLIVGGEGAGDDTYIGGIGTDTVKYSSAVNTILVDLLQGLAYGQDIGTDKLSEIENIIGGQADDTLIGDANANIINAYSGNDTITGGDGYDKAIYAGNKSSYTVTTTASGVTVVDKSGAEGTDTLTGIEQLVFADGTTDIKSTFSGIAYHWKSHMLLSGVSLSAGTQTSTSDASGVASFTSDTDATLTLTASRAIPSAEATATSAAVNLQDAIAILKMIVGLEVNGTGKALSPYQALAADYDGNGLVQLTDAIGVLKHVVGLTAPEPAWHFVNELDATVPGKTTLSPGVAQTSITASLSASSPVKVGLVGYLTGDVDGSYAGAAGSSSLTKTYFDALVDAHRTELSLAQFGVYSS